MMKGEKKGLASSQDLIKLWSLKQHKINKSFKKNCVLGFFFQLLNFFCISF